MKCNRIGGDSMSYILSIYSRHAFKECLLPAINNADYGISIEKELFGLTRDYEISMEIIDKKWKFAEEQQGQLYYTALKQVYKGEDIKHGDVLSLTLGWEEQISIIVKETNKSFSVYEKYDISNMSEVSFGNSEDNHFWYENLGLVSKRHCRIVRRDNNFVLEDMSSNGVFVNSKRIVGSRQLQFGDCIDIFGLRIVFLNQFIAVNASVENLDIEKKVLKKYIPQISHATSGKNIAAETKQVFHRSPRNIPKIESEKIEIEGPPSPKELNMQSTLMAIGPSLTMTIPMMAGCLLSALSTQASGGGSSAFMYTGLVTTISSALIGSGWSIVNMRRAKKTNREEENKRFEAYGEYLIKCTGEVKSKYENNLQGLRSLYPEAQVCSQYGIQNPELWNRNVRHEDFLYHRLGLGDIPFQVPIEVPKMKFTLVNDSLAEKPRMIKESYKMLHNVPVCVDLMKNHLIGLVGGDENNGCYSVMYNLVAQIAAGNCYTDVKLAFLYDEDKKKECWEFAKWLPHVWTEDKKTRLVAGNKNEASEVFYEITKVLRMRTEERDSSFGSKEIPKPYYILFLESPDLLEGELISKYILNSEENVGITTIMMTERAHELPNECEYIIENTANYQGMYKITDGLDERIPVAYDMITPGQLEIFARRLSSIEVNEVETGGEIPSVLTFFDMYGIHKLEELDVIERWKKNRTYESIKALVGQKAGGTDCYLDVHEKYHGPHGLVAGTTGSGKSETLQTYMLSLAINYSPDDIGFFIIDYKGGGMAHLFDGLPHMIGQISNLSGNQVRRAMVSIKSENLRRQRIFNEHGVNNINLYTRLYKNNEASMPIPHMFIIIDEFAELKREEPDFMRELISVAQVGRSLGVHLILATQKPSGTVDDNIWSNSKFRLCLRVQDKQDSMDMLHKPDAAYITQAGRSYLQVGNDELYELFQSAWSGAAYDEGSGSVQTDIAKMLSENGKAALVGSYAKIKQKEIAKLMWIDTLVEILEQAAEAISCSIKDCLYDNEVANSLAKQFFVIVEKRKIEYPMSDYNFRRVLDLINVYSSLLNTNVFEENGKLNAATEIMTYSRKERRKLPEMKEKTQLDAVVEYLAKVAKNSGYVHNLQLWLPVLPEKLYLKDLKGYQKYSFQDGKWQEKKNGFSLSTIVGLFDDPVNQAQEPLNVDLAVDGNHAIIGTISTGKSTFLMTYLYSLINRYTPDAVNLYVMDYSSKMLGALEDAPHVGGIMYENDDEKVSKFFTMLESSLKERKELFRGGNYSQYIQANGLVIPAMLIVIDNVAAFRTKTNSKYDDVLMTILKEGIGYGIYVVATASGFGMNEIPNRMAENFRSTICLEMNDKFAYTEVLRTLHLDVVPEENVKGRGIAKVGDSILEFQTALCIEAEEDYKRGEMIKVDCQTLAKAWTGKKAKPIPEIPAKPVWNEFSQLDEVVAMAKKGDRLPIGYDKKNAMVYGIDFQRTYCYLMSGKAGTGKTNALRLVVSSARLSEANVVVIDFAGDLKAVSEKVNARYVDSQAALFEFCKDITPDFKARNVVKNSCAAAGKTNEEIYEEIQQFKKIIIVISNLKDFVKKVHHPEEGIGDMVPFLNTLLEKGATHNVFWIAGFNQDEAADLAGYKIYNAFIKDKNGMHLGGNVSAQRILNFDYVPYMEQSKTVKKGIAMLPSNDEETTTTVVLPLYRTE